jgi:5-methylcytosine-specific restriction endonuclease McrA
MMDRYQLGRLGNAELLAALSGLVRSEHALVSDLLAHLAELDERRLFLELGYPSLFAYCTESLGFCKSSARRRIAAARVCRKYREAYFRFANGDLQLSVLCALGPHLNSQNAAELFDACSRKSCEQVEQLLAMRFPKPDVRDLIRRLPARLAAGTPAGTAVGIPADTIVGATAGTADGIPADTIVGATAGTADGAVAGTAVGSADIGRRLGPRPAVSVPDAPFSSQSSRQADRPSVRGRGAVEPLSGDRFGVHFTADAEFRELLEEVRALASHRYPVGDLMTLMKCGLEAYRRELQKARFGLGSDSRRARSARSAGGQSAQRTRHVPAAVAREVYVRDGGCCTFVSRHGRRCGSREFLELDHEKPWAEGGESSVRNLRLRCRAHNQQSAREHFGENHIRSAVARSRETKARDAESRELALPVAGVSRAVPER